MCRDQGNDEQAQHELRRLPYGHAKGAAAIEHGKRQPAMDHERAVEQDEHHRGAPERLHPFAGTLHRCDRNQAERMVGEMQHHVHGDQQPAPQPQPAFHRLSSRGVEGCPVPDSPEPPSHPVDAVIRRQCPVVLCDTISQCSCAATAAMGALHAGDCANAFGLGTTPEPGVTQGFDSVGKGSHSIMKTAYGLDRDHDNGVAIPSTPRCARLGIGHFRGEAAP